MRLGVLGAEGGQWSGYTSDVATNTQSSHGYTPQDQWAGGPGRVSWTPNYTNPPVFTDPHLASNQRYDSNILPGSNPSTRRIPDTRGRFDPEPPWPYGGIVTRQVGDHRYDVQQFTGYATSNVQAGGWQRGQIVKFMQPTVHPALPPIMYDPTDPDTWNVVRAYN